MNGSPWTADCEQQLLDLRNQGLTYAQMGERLGRTKAAIKARLSRLGLCSLTKDMQKRLTKAEIQLLTKLYADGWTVSAIAASMGREWHTIASHLDRLSLRERRARQEDPPEPTDPFAAAMGDKRFEDHPNARPTRTMKVSLHRWSGDFSIYGSSME